MRLAALDPRGPGDPGGQRGDRAEAERVLGHGLHQVTGDQEKVRGPGPNGVGVTRRLPRPATRTGPCLGRVGRASSTAATPGRPQNLLPLLGQLG